LFSIANDEKMYEVSGSGGNWFSDQTYVDHGFITSITVVFGFHVERYFLSEIVFFNTLVNNYHKSDFLLK